MQADGERAQGAREEKTDLRFAWRNGTHKQICGLHGGTERKNRFAVCMEERNAKTDLQFAWRNGT